jgi:hypothetical protein
VGLPKGVNGKIGGIVNGRSRRKEVERIPIHIMSQASNEYMKFVKFVTSIINPNERYDSRDYTKIYTAESTVTKLLQYTGWNAQELIEYSGWDGKEEFQLYPMNSKQIELELTCFYIGRKCDYRYDIMRAYWFHQIIPDFANDKIIFAFYGALGNLYQNYLHIIDNTTTESFRKVRIYDQEELERRDTGVLKGHYVVYIEENEMVYIEQNPRAGTTISVPTYAYPDVAKAIAPV